MLSHQLARLVEALQQQKEETRELQATFEARLSQQQQDINQSNVSIHGLVHSLMNQTNKQLGPMGIGGISPVPSNTSSSLDHNPTGLLSMSRSVEGTIGSIAQSQGSSEPADSGPGLINDVEDHLGPTPQPQVDISVATPLDGDEVIDHLRALKEEDKTHSTHSTQPSNTSGSIPRPPPTPGSSLPSSFSLPYTPVQPVPSTSAPIQLVQPVSNGFQYPKYYHNPRSNHGYNRQPDLIFPDALPYKQETHYFGRWILTRDMRKVWITYERALDADELPINVPTDPAHWVNRRYPNGLFLTDQGAWVMSAVSGRFFQQGQPPTHTPPSTGLTPTTAYTSPGHQGMPLEETSMENPIFGLNPLNRGSLESVETLNWLTSVKYSTVGKGSAVEFIIKFDEVLTQYNDSKPTETDRLSDSIKKLFLQQAFVKIKLLNDISAREQEGICNNGSQAAYTYEKYKEILTNAATRFDMDHRVPTDTSRRAHMMTIEDATDQESTDEVQASTANQPPSPRH
ncbi:unknown protein [Seminavis robusta]|uniref:Uncharacterized protein n=1 Tax=Seminavis robusta TaxID=568900 RepID=A0A9N8ENE3_9STRA|nr:unknown protein [Seminavis robusta]|eukprot:Sro1280_g258890.1 n/a (512) ;mRNA; r:4507-6773